ncbi:DM13 domain-containing protein [Amycolatopsis sp. SID8362]|uniref:DM13 domain-containing protein n=1 Tax=Amycolatopsis sp. SID8362 TaxID=2690346 RepID=UPI00136B1CFC|nr:DM13 domain-containing protein [Amycolatopsis sp. SID8362]NBH09537.1 electron transporter [Amycolatopsis sp. SID8362]NED46229.1 DM13 domain-containing protein [Amycolatopsis sp. SID8362]
MNGKTRLLARPWLIGVLAAGLAAVAVGLYWFQPWQLWVDETVQETLPTAAAPEASKSAAPQPVAPVEVAAGRLISHEHETTGTVRILRAADGSLLLRLEDLVTSSGPDVHVWLADAPVKPGKDGWGVFDDGKYLDAGKLKGNKGNQNYALPAGTDLAGYTSVSIWCDRFNVSFGAAELSR